MPVPNVLKILDDLKYKSVGVDPNTKKMPEGFFVSFRPIGLAIPEADFRNPWTPTGANLKEILAPTPKNGLSPAGIPGSDPATVAPVSASPLLEKMSKDQLLAAGVAETQMTFINTFMLTDDKLQMNGEYRTMPGAGKVNDAWFSIINGANGIASKMELNDEMKKQFADASAVLYDKDGSSYTPKHQAYDDCLKEYTDAVQERDRQYANVFSDPMKLQMWPIQGKTYQDTVDRAWNKWQGYGCKAEIDKANATLAAIGIDPAILLIGRAKLKYENSLMNFAGFGLLPYTFMLPRTWYSKSGSGWNEYSESDYHSETHSEFSSSNSEAFGGLSLGFVSVFGAGTSAEQRTELDITTTNLSITFEYTSVDIKRPWLDTTLLNLSNWFLVGDYPASCISDGTFGQELRTNEMLFLPSVVTSLILIRNVNIQFEEVIEHKDSFEKITQGGGLLTLGPLVIGGRSTNKEREYNSTYDHGASGIRIDGVQLIGYVSTILPASPKLASKEYMK